MGALEVYVYLKTRTVFTPFGRRNRNDVLAWYDIAWWAVWPPLNNDNDDDRKKVESLIRLFDLH